MLTCTKFLLFPWIWISLGFAAKTPLQWESVESPFLVLQQGASTDRSWFRKQVGEARLWSYDAGLSTENEVPEECRWLDFKRDHPELEIGALTSLYLQKCEQKIRRRSWGWIEDYYRTMFVRIDVSEHPFMKRVLLHLPNGYQQPALLALKDTQTKRPLIIFRAGIFGNSLDIQAERHLIIQLFEQGPFNLLFLDSATSPETVKWNSVYTAGGLDEGLQNYQIADQITSQSEPLSKLIDGIHLMGVSMGGHGLWLSLALNEINPRVFKSALAFCPLVQFEKTFQSHQAHPVSFFFMNLWAYFRLSLLRERRPELSSRSILMDSFQSLAKGYKGPLTDEGKLLFPKIEGFHKDDYFSGNNMVPLLKSIRTPVTVFSSQIETLVPYDLNFEFLKEQTKSQPNFYLNSLAQGFHCTFPGAYDWDQFSAMVKAQVLERDTSLSKRYIAKSIPLAIPKVELPQSPELKVTTQAGKPDLLVRFLSRRGIEVQARIPIDQLDWATSEVVRSDSEARALIRWARANMELVSEPSPQIVWKNLKATP